MVNTRGESSKAGALSEWGPFRVISESIRNKLLISLLALSLIPLILLGGVTYLITSDALMENAFDALRTAQTNKAVAIRNHFDGRRGDMNGLVETADALRTKAFDRLIAIRELKRNLVESYFFERMKNLQVMTETPLLGDAFRAFGRVSSAVGGASWQEVEQAYGPFLVNFNETYGYYDTYLVSGGGKILYTVGQAEDLGASLTEGELVDSPAGRAFLKGREGRAFEDFDFYAPAEGQAAAFIAAPVREGEDLLGVIMAQISVDQLDFIMQGPATLGTGVETYMVGPDRLFRSNSIYITERTIINPAFRVETEGIGQALAGQSGQGVSINYLGEYVLSVWTPVRVEDRRWALVSEISIDDAFVPGGSEEEADFFTQYKEEYGYDDLGLVDPDGFLFYSVQKGPDYRTNLMAGPYSDTNLGRLVRQVMETQSFGMAPFERYGPNEDQPAAFFAMPLVHGDQVELVVITRLSVALIDAVMQERSGMGETSDSYLVGADGLLRSNARLVEANTVLNPDFRFPPEVAQSMTRTAGTDVVENRQGRSVLRSWSPLVVVPETEGTGGAGAIRWAVVSEVGYDEVRSPIRTIATISLGLLAIVAILVVIGALWLSRGLTTQVRHINTLFQEIGTGNFAARAPVTAKDELGAMAGSLNAMLDDTLTLIQSSEERDTMQAAIMRLLEEISGLAEGDLRVRAEVSEDFTGAIADSFNDMAQQLGEVVRNVQSVTRQVSATSKEASAATEDLAETSQHQATQITDAIAAIDTMAAAIRQVAENAGRLAEVSERSTANARDGAEAVRRTNAAMESIREHVQETARAIKRLGESSQEVGNIVQLINDIADRTSILALNASIQAAMAGESGRGFAVVAEEVQRLAERSTNATKQIDTLIKNIQGEIGEAGTSMEESIQRVVEGSKLADGAYGQLQEIENVAVQLAELIQSISTTSRQQAQASQRIAKTMASVGEISARTSEASRETAASMRNLAAVSDRLNESVSVFRLEEE